MPLIREDLELLIRGFQGLDYHTIPPDVEIICGESVWYAHKTILAIHSPLFPRAWQYCAERPHGVPLYLNLEDPAIVNIFCEFLYKFDYDAGNMSLLQHLMLFYLAYKWEMSLLCSVSLQKFKEKLAATVHEPEFVDNLKELCDTNSGRITLPGDIVQHACFTFVQTAVHHGPVFAELKEIPDPFLQQCITELDPAEARRHNRNPIEIPTIWACREFRCARCHERFRAVIPKTMQNFNCPWCQFSRHCRDWYPHGSGRCTFCTHAQSSEMS